MLNFLIIWEFPSWSTFYKVPVVYCWFGCWFVNWSDIGTRNIADLKFSFGSWVALTSKSLMVGFWIAHICFFINHEYDFVNFLCYYNNENWVIECIFFFFINLINKAFAVCFVKYCNILFPYSIASKKPIPVLSSVLMHEIFRYLGRVVCMRLTGREQLNVITSFFTGTSNMLSVLSFHKV